MANCAGIERKWATSCGCFEARTDVLRRNKSAFVFWCVLILFILHANAPIRERNVKKDIGNTGYGGSTGTKTSYSNICRWHPLFRQCLYLTLFSQFGTKWEGEIRTPTRSQVPTWPHWCHISHQCKTSFAISPVCFKCWVTFCRCLEFSCVKFRQNIFNCPFDSKTSGCDGLWPNRWGKTWNPSCPTAWLQLLSPTPIILMTLPGGKKKKIPYPYHYNGREMNIIQYSFSSNKYRNPSEHPKKSLPPKVESQWHLSLIKPKGQCIPTREKVILNTAGNVGKQRARTNLICSLSVQRDW